MRRAAKHEQALERLLVIPDAELLGTHALAATGTNTSEVRWVRHDRVRSSPDQTRLVDDAAAVEALAHDIQRDTLLAYPVVRHDPESDVNDERFVLVCGHRRCAALQLLEQRGVEHPVLRRDTTTGALLVPVRVVEGDALVSCRRTIAENLVRETLSPWEHAVALALFQQRLHDAGERSSLRSLEESLGVPRTTLEPLVRIGRSVTADVLVQAGLLAPGVGDVRAADARQLCQLTQAALNHAAKRATISERAVALRRALDAHARSAPRAPKGCSPDDGHRVRPVTPGVTEDRGGFAIHIRTPLEELSPRRAVRHALAVADALRRLIAIGASRMQSAEVQALRDCLDAAVADLPASKA